MDDETRARGSEDGADGGSGDGADGGWDDGAVDRPDDGPNGVRPLAALTDDDLLHQLTRILAQSRRVESDLVALVAEVDARRLFARLAFPSMFAYCTAALHLSESEANLRIAVARASREHPMVLTMLGDGRLHLSGIALLAPHLTRENRETLLRRATHRSKREVEELVAELAPRPDAPARIRKLPEPRFAAAIEFAAPSRMGRTVTSGLSGLAVEPTASGPMVPLPAGASAAVPPSPGTVTTTQGLGSPCRGPTPPQPPAAPPVLEPLAPGRYKVQFTASAELHRKLERLRALMRSRIPDGDIGAIIEAAVDEKLERLEARRFGATSRPRKTLSQAHTSPGSRHIPSPVRRAVRERDGERCRFVDAQGRRCGERDRLEFHHRRPFGLGGDHRADNVCLMCHAHNAHLAEHDYGRGTMSAFRRPVTGAGAMGAGGTGATRAGPAAVATRAP